MATPNKRPREAVVLDTNAWVRGTRLLRTPLALALVHTAAKRGSLLLLPEVVEKELHAVMARSCLEASSQIRKARDELRSLLSREVSETRLPDEKTAAAAVNERLEQCATLIERVPLTLVHCRRALERVYHKRPPCDRTEEFRDAIIWEVVREWSQRMPVFFVTQDSAFYKNRDCKSGLAESLSSDVLGKVTISQDLSFYLKECGKGTASLPAKKRVTAVLRDRVREHVYGLDPEQTVELNDMTSVELEPFFTDHPEHVAYRFRLTYDGRTWFDDGEPTACPILVVGEALLDREMAVLELELDRIRVGDQPELLFSEEREELRFEHLAPIPHRVPARGRPQAKRGA